ncbi:MAG: hypothetical protein KIT76_17210 [Pseudolabrys sp.]|nr:hypothetical protein [Pseudolabrys sp.]
MTDIIGPANAPNAVTIRPADSRGGFGVNDTWFKDCTSPAADDGTDIQAGWLNKITAVLRSAIRGNGNAGGGDPVVTEDDADDILLKAVQHLIQRGQQKFASDAGSADALVVTLNPAPVEYKQGMNLLVKKGAAANATTTPTINVNGLGTKTIVRCDGDPLQPKDMLGAGYYELAYDGVAFRVVQFVASQRLVQPYLGFHGDPVSQSFANNTQAIVSGYTGIVNNLPGASHSSGIITIGTTGYYAVTANMLALMPDPAGSNYFYAITVSKVDGGGSPLASIACLPVAVTPASRSSNLAGGAAGIVKLTAGDRIAAFFVHNQGASQDMSISLDVEFRGAA